MVGLFATGTADPAKGIILKFLSFAALLVVVVVFVALSEDGRHCYN